MPSYENGPLSQFSAFNAGVLPNDVFGVAINWFVNRNPLVSISLVTGGTSRLMRVIYALPSTESAVPRRLLNQRATTPEAITGPVPASPSGTSTP